MSTVPLHRYVMFLLLAAGGCAVDLATKSWIFGWLGNEGEKPSYWLFDGVFGFGFTTSLNEGALFGVGQGQVVFFTILSLTAAVAILYWLFIGGAVRDGLLNFAMGCVMAGILGNMYDRVGLPGLHWNGLNGRHPPGEPVYAVRDWLHFKINPIDYHWPIFNIADSLLVCGAAMLIWHAWKNESTAGHSATSDATSVGDGDKPAEPGAPVAMDAARRS